MFNVSEEFKKTKEKKDWTKILQIVASIATIIGIIGLAIPVWQFNTELTNQKITQFNEHLSNIKSLKLELNQDIDVMINAVNNRNYFITNRTFHNQFTIENLRRSVSDGTIQNIVLKSWIMATYFDAVGLNNRILYVNSPEFDTLLLIDYTQFYHHILHFQNQTIDIMQNLTKSNGSFNTTLNIVSQYENCLESKQSIADCQNITFCTP